MGVSVGVDGRELDMISCKALNDRSCLSPIENCNDGDVFLPPWPYHLLHGRWRWQRENMG